MDRSRLNLSFYYAVFLPPTQLTIRRLETTKQVLTTTPTTSTTASPGKHIHLYYCYSHFGNILSPNWLAQLIKHWIIARGGRGWNSGLTNTQLTTTNRSTRLASFV